MIPKYECDRCGACCRGTLIVEAYYLDVLREPRLLEADICGRRPSIAELAEDDGRCIVLAANQPCRFLAPDGRCTIYPTRPNNCVEMEAGDEQCQEARSRVGLPRLLPSHTTQSAAMTTPPVS